MPEVVIRDSQPGISVASSSPLRFHALFTRTVPRSRSTSPTHNALISPNRNPVPAVTANTSPCLLASRTAVSNSRSVKNRSSGLDCLTLDCFGAVPIAGFAASQPRFTAYANTP